MPATKPKQERYIPLFDEIKNHVFQWATDPDWKKLPTALNVAMTQLMNEIKIQDTLNLLGIKDDRIENDEKKNVEAFIGIFKRKYIQLADMPYTEPVSPVDRINIKRVIKTIANEGGTYMEFLEWYFDEFCSLESSKQYMPPRISPMCSNFIVTKFLYQMKDAFKLRKQEIKMQSIRNILLGIALPFAERSKSKELSQKILDFSSQTLTVSKFFDLLKAFASKYNDQEAIEACEKIDTELKKAKSNA